MLARKKRGAKCFQFAVGMRISLFVMGGSAEPPGILQKSLGIFKKAAVLYHIGIDFGRNMCMWNVLRNYV